MPKALFFSLPADKRQRVFDASFEEFSNLLFNEVSINQIIKKADISRGSFYQYFYDKEDLYFYLIGNILNEKMKSFINEINPQSTAPFSSYRQMFILNLLLLSDETYKPFFKNMYLSMTFELNQRFNKLMEEIKEVLLSEFKELLLTKEILLTDKEQKEYVVELFKIVQLINRDLVLMKIAKNIDNEQIMKIYDIRIRILRGEVQFNF